MCGVVSDLTKHHLVPQVKARKNHAGEEETIWICSLCHTTLHAKFSESYLRDNLNTLEKIMGCPDMQTYIEWRKKHLSFSSNSTKKERR